MQCVCIWWRGRKTRFFVISLSKVGRNSWKWYLLFKSHFTCFCAIKLHCFHCWFHYCFSCPLTCSTHLMSSWMSANISTLLMNSPICTSPCGGCSAPFECINRLCFFCLETCGGTSWFCLTIVKFWPHVAVLPMDTHGSHNQWSVWIFLLLCQRRLSLRP